MILKTHEGKPVKLVEAGLVTGHLPLIPVPMAAEDVEFGWNGAVIPEWLVLETVAFAKMCYDKWGGEVQGRLYYNEEKDEWKSVTLPQYISRTLHSDECGDEEPTLRDKMLLEVGAGWVQNGTWHSHANASAFQSGTDHNDEIKQAGIHYTIGNLASIISPSFHARYSFRGCFYELEYEDVMEGTDASVAEAVAAGYPEEWDGCLFEKPVFVPPYRKHVGYKGFVGKIPPYRKPPLRGTQFGHDLNDVLPEYGSDEYWEAQLGFGVEFESSVVADEPPSNEALKELLSKHAFGYGDELVAILEQCVKAITFNDSLADGLKELHTLANGA